MDLVCAASESVIFLLLFFLQSGWCSHCDTTILKEPGLVVTTTDSITTFSCSVLGVSRPQCRYIFNEEEINPVVLFWEINGVGQYFSSSDLLLSLGVTISTNCPRQINIEEYIQLSRDRLDTEPSDFCLNELACVGNITIPANIATNGTVVRCGVYSTNCETNPENLDSDEIHFSAPGSLSVQDILEAPANVHLTELNATTLILSWDPPSFPQVAPISNYTVLVENHLGKARHTISAAGFAGIPFLKNNSFGSVQYLYERSCGVSYFSVYASNILGTGASSAVLQYSTDSLQNVTLFQDTVNPEVLSILCSFTEDTQAIGCRIDLVFEQDNGNVTETFNVTIRQDGAEALGHHSIPDSGTRIYRVSAVQIGCDGEFGINKFVRYFEITSGDDFSLPEGALIGIAVTTAVVFSLCILLAILFTTILVRKKSGKRMRPLGQGLHSGHDGTHGDDVLTSPRPTHLDGTDQYDSHSYDYPVTIQRHVDHRAPIVGQTPSSSHTELGSTYTYALPNYLELLPADSKEHCDIVVRSCVAYNINYSQD